MKATAYSYSKTGLALTESFEGCKLEAYRDSGGVPTIGYGHTRGVHLGMTCTREDAEEWLRLDMAMAEAVVKRCVHADITQDEYDALVDFEFNTGHLPGSTMLRLVNAGDMHGAAAEFEKWDKVKGAVVAGLLRRRNAEESLFAQ
jgi:lysozyme